MQPSKLFFISSISFIIGIASALLIIKKFTFLNYEQFCLLTYSFIFLFIILLSLFWENQKIRLIALIGLFLFLGIFRYTLSLPRKTKDNILFYNNKKVKIIGIIIKEPDRRAYNQKLTLDVKKVMEIGENLFFKNVKGKILMTAKLHPIYNYGDKLEFECKLKKPKPFKDFAYDRYLARYDIYSICSYPKNIKFLSSNNGFFVVKKIYKLKNKLAEAINNNMQTPESNLLSAILLGKRRGVPKKLLNEFSQVGISHIIAISGMHITIIGAIIMNILLFFGMWRKQAFLLAIIFLFFYVILIGFPASAVRAGIMAFLVLLALNYGRLSKLINSLLLTACILLFLNPKLLYGDVGFQLSFLSILGINYFYPIINSLFNKFGNFLSHFFDKLLIKQFSWKGIRDILSITLSAQLMAFPIIIYHFHQVSIMSPLANILILPTLPFIMVFGIIAIIISLVLPQIIFFQIIKTSIFLPVFFLLKYLILISEIIAKLPYAFLKINHISLTWIFLIYLILGLIIYFNKREGDRLVI